MNEHIKRLAVQAEKTVKSKYPNDPMNIGVARMMTVFAELLAQEAADVAYNTYWNNPDTVRGAHLKQAIKQHFGVEE